jgi:hypothetical protein
MVRSFTVKVEKIKKLKTFPSRESCKDLRVNEGLDLWIAFIQRVARQTSVGFPLRVEPVNQHFYSVKA